MEAGETLSSVCSATYVDHLFGYPEIIVFLYIEPAMDRAGQMLKRCDCGLNTYQCYLLWSEMEEGGVR